MSAAIAFSTTFEVIECYSCGVMFAMTQEKNRHCLEDGGNFWCPNGHRQHYITSKIQKLEKKLEAQKRETEKQTKFKEWAQTDAKIQCSRKEHAERRVTSYKGHATRLRKRIANGKCPCCSETFQNVKAHIAKVHPLYVPKEDDGDD